MANLSRDELIWRMAEAAWGWHFCWRGATKRFCEECQAQRSSAGNVECFELSGGFKRGSENMEWRNAAEGALLALEAATGVEFCNQAAIEGARADA